MITKGEREFISPFLDLYEITVYKYCAHPTLGNFDSIHAMYKHVSLAIFFNFWSPVIIAIISNEIRMNIFYKHLSN